MACADSVQAIEFAGGTDRVHRDDESATYPENEDSAQMVPNENENDRTAIDYIGLNHESAAALFASFDAVTREGFLASLSTAVPDLTGRPATPVSALISDTGSPTATPTT